MKRLVSYWLRHRVIFALLTVAALVFVLDAPSMSGQWMSSVAYAQSGSLEDKLMAEAQKRQVSQFNPEAALQKRIFADGFVPNSPEFSLQQDGVAYAAQRAESLTNGAVRVYYVVSGDWGNVSVAERGKTGGNALGETLLREGEKRLALRFNPNAVLQKQIFADGFVPNSGEFGVQGSDGSYLAQRAENLANGEVRVYYAVVGDWGNIHAAARDASGVARTITPAPSTAAVVGPTTGQAFGRLLCALPGTTDYANEHVAPRAGVPIQLLKRLSGDTWQVAYRTVTDADGRWRFNNVAPEKYIVNHGQVGFFRFIWPDDIKEVRAGSVVDFGEHRDACP